MSETLASSHEGLLGAAGAVLAAAWLKVRQSGSLKPVKASIARLQAEQSELVRKDEFEKTAERLFDKLDENRRHYDGQFLALTERVDRLIDRR